MPITVAAYTPSVPVGPHQATCTNVREHAAKLDPSNIFRIWEFTLDDGRTVDGSSSLSTSPKSKGGKWLAALIGHVPEAGETVEPIGCRATIIVELDDNGYERVTTVAPPESRKASSPVKPLREATQKAAELHAAQEDPTPGDELPF